GMQRRSEAIIRFAHAEGVYPEGNHRDRVGLERSEKRLRVPREIARRYSPPAQRAPVRAPRIADNGQTDVVSRVDILEHCSNGMQVRHPGGSRRAAVASEPDQWRPAG